MGTENDDEDEEVEDEDHGISALKDDVDMNNDDTDNDGGTVEVGVSNGLLKKMLSSFGKERMDSEAMLLELLTN